MSNKAWLIEPANTLVFVFDYRNAPRPELAAYLYRHFPHANVRWRSPKDQVVIARNLTIEHGVRKAPANITDFVFFDEDMRPDARTDFMFETPGDIVGAQYPLRDTSACALEAWLKPTTVHCGAMRFTRDVAMRLDMPLFKFEYNAQHTRCTKCECGYFTEKAIEMGFTVARGGFCEHDNDHSWSGR